MQFTRPWYDLRSGEDSSRRFDIAIALSVLLHAAALFLFVPKLDKDFLAPGEVKGESAPPLSVAIAPRVRPPQPPADAAPPPPSPPVIAVPPRPARPSARPTPRPPPMAAIPREPLPEPLRVPPPTVEPLPLPAPRPEPRRPSPPAETDLAAYIAARRAERGESSAPSAAESEAQRRERALQRNLASLNVERPFMGDPKNGGGLFRVTLKSYDFAEFQFYGWNSDLQRKTPQRFEVRKGDNATIDLAIVRKMIEIIRQTEKGDFLWRSERQGKDITLSARPEDNQRLEEFLVRDLFG